jgi:two-component system, NtrC family, sensor histidine kinase HydH
MGEQTATEPDDMRHLQFSRYAGPLVALGGLLAVACLASTWYINRLQSDLARAVRHDAARMEAAEELQIHLRQLRFHSLMAAADPTPPRRELVDEDRRLVDAGLATAHREFDSEDDVHKLDALDRAYRAYEVGLAADAPSSGDRVLVQWADGHHVSGLLIPCRELADKQREQIAASLERSEAQSTWAGRVLLGLGIIGALGGLLSGYATARGLTRRAAKLSVRVRAVHAQLDQEVGAMTLEGSNQLGDLDEQLDRVVGRVQAVCHRLQVQERDLLRAEQLAAVGHLAAGVAHEIRNPLTGIKFLVEAAMRPNDATPLTPEDLGLIRQEVLRIERTVQGLLNYARSAPAVPGRWDLRDLLAEAVAVVRGRADAKSVIVQETIGSEAMITNVDRDQILSALTNLLINAIEAAPSSGEVEIRAEHVPGDGTLKVEVIDNGPGVDPAIADRLFTPFTTTKRTGTGLGLTLARRVAQEHGGTLTAASRHEGGACFILTLPDPERSDVQTARR